MILPQPNGYTYHIGGGGRAMNADGPLFGSNLLGDHRGSIHHVCAAARLSIDHLRQQVRAGL
jgi:hypothetical protein